MTTIRNFGFCTYENGRVDFPSAITISSATISIFGIMNGVTNITMTMSSTLELSGSGRTYNQFPGSYSFGGDLVLYANSIILITPNLATGVGVAITTNSLFIESGSNIQGTGRGYPANQGPGKGVFTTSILVSGNTLLLNTD